MPLDPSIRDHKAWIGYLQPDGLVVSPAALVDAQVVLDRTSAPLQQRFQTLVEEIPHGDDKVPAVTSLERLLKTFLEWPDNCLYGLSPERPIPESLKIPLRDFGETLEPTLAFQQPHPEDPDHPWLLLVQDLPPGTNLNDPIESKLAGWSASPTRRFERLLREAQVPIGLLASGSELRLLYAPRGENGGTLTFPVKAMTEIAGRPILGAFHLLLCRYRLLAAPSEARLPALLKRSRDYQSRVSTALAQQVLDALYELLRGFQAADDHTHGELLKAVLADDPDQVYSGLLTVLMRLVFLLYAEDQGLMPDSDLYARNYAIHGLFERLRADAEQYPDTMEHRYGAWAQLVALFRAVHRGCKHSLIKMPAREGHLFDPDRYRFLEGRTGTPQPEGQPLKLPLVPDGTVYRVLEKLLVLDGERLSYRTLDVEQIGSVYETMMGFRLERAAGTSIAMKPAKAHGAPTPVNLDELLATRAADRAKYIQDRTDYKITATMTNAVKAAESVDDLLAALERRIARNSTPQPVSAGTMVLVPTDERRKSGSHYTPRSLTEPIVRTALEPVLKQLGEQPTPDQILNLKVCDPAMGSGAFLVEACRQLADALVAAWVSHGYKPYIPPDEDEVLHARRLVAQRCLYGVDRNPMAVDLAKLSLWLATLAKDHPFTFLDHNLRAGDSLVGLTRKQIVGFDLEPSAQIGFVEAKVRDRMNAATAARRTILEAGDDMLPGMKQQKLHLADEALDLIRLAGDAVVAAFFAGSRPRERAQKRDELFNLLDGWLQRSDSESRAKLGSVVRQLHVGRIGLAPIKPFHWEVEFPEVFLREAPGFDAFVGNPPFVGGKKISGTSGKAYGEWLCIVHPGANGNADLVAHFFRRAFLLLRKAGTFGLIATNSIAQGDTRRGGLKAIRESSGSIYSALRRLRWPGTAAVVVSVIHAIKGSAPPHSLLDGKSVEIITSYLFHQGGDEDPLPLGSNEGLSHIGCDLKAQGFLFDDNDDQASGLSVMEQLLRQYPKNKERIRRYLGGEELNNHPECLPHRFVIDFGQLSEQEARRWPDLFALVESKVVPERASKESDLEDLPFWQFWRARPELRSALGKLSRALAINCGACPYMAFAFVDTDIVFAHSLTVIAIDSFGAFCTLQSRVHEIWARFFSSSMKDDLRYTSNSFISFPLPLGEGWRSLDQSAQRWSVVSAVGQRYYEARAKIMASRRAGLTATYNLIHDPVETSSDVLHLRELHDAIDRAVLDAFGWTDIRPTCEFLLDYEEEDGEDEDGGRARNRRKPWRYRWPDDIRDEVLARLLKLNAERAAGERRTGAAAAAEKKKATKAKPPGKAAKVGKPRKPKTGEPDLFPLDRNQRYVLMLLRAWEGRPLTRRALNAGMILMLEDQLRTALLDNAQVATGESHNATELNHIYTELSIDGLITIDNTGAQQVVRITETAPSTNTAAPEDVERINAVKEYFRREQANARVTVSEETVDAEFDFVPA